MGSAETPELEKGRFRRGSGSRLGRARSHPPQRWALCSCGESLCDVRRPLLRMFLHKTDWGVLYKLLAGCLGGGLLNVISCRLFLKIRSHFNVFNNRLLHPWEQPSRNPLK